MACKFLFLIDMLQVKGGLEGFPMMLVGNKCDEEAGGWQAARLEPKYFIPGGNIFYILFQASGKCQKRRVRLCR